MDEAFQLGDRLPSLVERVVASYQADDRTKHIDRALLPSPAAVEELIDRLLELLFPGFIGRQDLNSFNVGYHVGELLPRIADLVYAQVEKCLCYRRELDSGTKTSIHDCEKAASTVTLRFLERIVPIREMLARDVQAAYDGDPAAINCDEVLLAYPGMLAIAVHRCAHEFYAQDVPMLPRMMSEWVHQRTGIDIHPGADIGRSFFIDHGTGVVIGETTVIGDNVKIYQGVTLGALSFPKDERGRIIRGSKRHPTVEDDVTIYANAIILGGETVLRKGCTIGGSVFLTSSVPAGAIVALAPPALRMRDKGVRTEAARYDGLKDVDFQI